MLAFDASTAPVPEQDNEDDDTLANIDAYDALWARAAQFIPVNTTKGGNSRYDASQAMDSNVGHQQGQGFITLELAEENDYNKRKARRAQRKLYEHVPGRGPSAILKKQLVRYSLRPGKRMNANAAADVSASSSTSIAALQARCARVMADVPLLPPNKVKAPAALEASPRLSPRPQTRTAPRYAADPSPLETPLALPPLQPSATPLKAMPASSLMGYPAAPSSRAAQGLITPRTAAPGLDRAAQGSMTPRAAAATSTPRTAAATPGGLAPGQTTPRTAADASSRAADGWLTQRAAEVASSRAAQRSITPRGPAATPRGPAPSKMTPRTAAATSRTVAATQITPRTAAAASRSVVQGQTAPQTPRSPRYIPPPKPVVPLTPRGVDTLRFHVAANATGAAAAAAASASASEYHRASFAAGAGAADGTGRGHDPEMGRILDLLVTDEQSLKEGSVVVAAAVRKGAGPLGAAVIEEEVGCVEGAEGATERGEADGAPASCRCGCAIM